MKKALYSVLAALALSACAGAQAPRRDLSAFEGSRPVSILIVPVLNESVEVTAPDYFLSSVTVPVAERGYYVFPVNAVKRMMEDDGLADAGLVHKAPTTQLAALFGADAVLYVTIKSWTSAYVVLSSTTTVALEYKLADGKTGASLWEDSRIVRYTPQSSGSGDPLAMLIGMAITAAVEKAAPNYMMLAQQANAQAAATLPEGKYLSAKRRADAQAADRPRAEPATPVDSVLPNG
jgi:hypothetical protein